MESLHKLVCLGLASCCEIDSELEFSCDWHGFRVLQQLHIYGQFKADTKLIGLVELPRLNIVNMRHAKPADHASAFFLGSLAKHMALKRRRVKFQCMYSDPEIQN